MATLYITAGNTGGGATTDLYKYVDAGGSAGLLYNGTTAGTLTAITLSGAGTGSVASATTSIYENFRGVAFSPDDGVGAIGGLGGTTAASNSGNAIVVGGSATLLDGNGVVDQSNFMGGTLTAILSGTGATASDTLGLVAGNSISYSGTTSGNILYGDNLIGTYTLTSGASSTLTVTFNTPKAETVGNTNANPVSGAAVQALLNQITFSTTGATGNRTVSFQVTENNGTADTAVTQTVSVSNAPLINALGTLNINQSASQQTVNLSGIQHNGGSGTITVSAQSNNVALTGSPAVNYTSPNSTGTVTFTPVAGVSGTATITVTVSDSGGSSATNETVNVIAPPVNTLPGGQSVLESSAAVLSTANGNAVSIADAAVGSGMVQIALSVSHGTLTLSETSELTFSSGANGQSSFTLTGTVSNIDAALNGLIYAPTAGYSGTDTLQLVSNDLGHTASGSPQSSTSTVALTVAAPPPVRLNEIEANSPGTQDNRYQYVELSGTPGTSLNNIYFVAYDGTAGHTAGTADLVVNLSGYSLGSNGLLVIQSSSSTGHSIPAATTLVADPSFFTQSGGFINGTLSFFLYDSPNGAFTQDTNYDPDHDGTLANLPSGRVVLDNVAIPNTNEPDDIVYGNVTVTEQASQNLGTADAVTRFPYNTSTTSAAWFGGELNDTDNVDSTIDYDETRESANEPAGAYLTPGTANFEPNSTVTVTSGNSVYDGAAYVPATTVTGIYGTDTGASLNYTYYAGSAVNGSPLTGAPTGVGTYTVIANFAGDTTYAAANSAPKTFLITAKSLTPSILAANKTYDGTTTASVTYALAGIVGSDSVTASGTATFATASVGTGIAVNATGITLGVRASGRLFALQYDSRHDRQHHRQIADAVDSGHEQDLRRHDGSQCDVWSHGSRRLGQRDG